MPTGILHAVKRIGLNSCKLQKKTAKKKTSSINSDRHKMRRSYILSFSFENAIELQYV